MIRRNIVYCISLLVSIHVAAQLDKEYFEKLRKEKVESSDALVWKQFGPGMSGYCEEFWCHPTDAGVMFMGPDMHVSYGTWDDGHSWHTLKDCDGTGQDMKRVIEMDFSRQNPDFGLALDWNGEVYETRDRGHRWECIYKLGKRHSALAVDPNDDSVWYVGAGDFWNVKANHRSLEHLHGIQLPFAAYGCVWKSTDKGRTWKKYSNGLPEKMDIGKIIVDPRNSSVIYLVGGHGIYKSKDGGKNWIVAAKGLPNNLPRDLTSYYDKRTGEFILYLLEQTFYEKDRKGSLTSRGGVYVSKDGAENWTDITGNIPVDMTQITGGSLTGFQYTRALAHWFGIEQNEVKKQFPARPTSILPVFNRIVVNPMNKDEIYITQNAKHDFTFPVGEVMKTVDGGKHWIVCAREGKYWNEKRDEAYWKSRNNPVGGNMKFAHLQREMDDKDYSSGNRFLTINAKGDVFICVDQQVLRSNDGGESWQQIDDNETAPGSRKWVGRGDSNLPGRFMLLDTGVKNRILLCCGEHGLWQTADLGGYPDKDAVAVEQLDGQCIRKGAHSIATVAVNPKNPQEIYTLVFRQEHRGAFRCSADGGKTWKNRSVAVPYDNKNLSGAHLYQYSLTVDYQNPERVYFCVMRTSVTEVGEGKKTKDFDAYGVYASSNGGKTWALSNEGLPDKCSVNRTTMDPHRPEVLYAALNKSGKVNGGLYRTDNHGEEWQQMDIPDIITSVNHVFVDKNTGYIYISCGTKTGTAREGGVWRSKNKGKTWQKIFEMPYVWQAETSPVDSDIIIVSSAGCPGFNERQPILNPGAYLSKDSGRHWTKVNKNLGQPDKIVDIKPDIHDRNVFWCALWGSGWYKGVLTE